MATSALQPVLESWNLPDSPGWFPESMDSNCNLEFPNQPLGELFSVLPAYDQNTNLIQSYHVVINESPTCQTVESVRNVENLDLTSGDMDLSSSSGKKAQAVRAFTGNCIDDAIVIDDDDFDRSHYSTKQVVSNEVHHQEIKAEVPDHGDLDRGSRTSTPRPTTGRYDVTVTDITIKDEPIIKDEVTNEGEAADRANKYEATVEEEVTNEVEDDVNDEVEERVTGEVNEGATDEVEFTYKSMATPKADAQKPCQIGGHERPVRNKRKREVKGMENWGEVNFAKTVLDDLYGYSMKVQSIWNRQRWLWDMHLGNNLLAELDRSWRLMMKNGKYWVDSKLILGFKECWRDAMSKVEHQIDKEDGRIINKFEEALEKFLKAVELWECIYFNLERDSTRRALKSRRVQRS